MPKQYYEDGREYDNGDTEIQDGVLMEVHSVSYTEDENGKRTFSYGWITLEEAEAERQREIDHQEALEKERKKNDSDS